MRSSRQQTRTKATHSTRKGKRTFGYSKTLQFLASFKDVIGKEMSDKEFNQLFMKIDADSNGSVEWNEFMNYMLLEN